VVLSQEGSRLTGHSLPHTSESELTPELLVEGSAVSGVGKWLGFGRDLKINTGDWQLRWVDEAAKQEQYHLAV
jgi:hypothetical protein